MIIGEIIKAQGVRGEVKIKPITNDITRFKKLRTVYAGTVLYQIAALRISGEFVYIRFAGVDDRVVAEALVGKHIEVDRIHAIMPEENEYFIADLLGCDFIIDGKICGKISNIHQNGAADVFEIALADGKTMMFPFLKRLNLKVDTESNTVAADSQTLNEVVVIN